MKTMSDPERVEVETLLRQRLHQLADHAPTTVQVPGEVQVVALSARRNRRRFGVIAAVTALVGAGSFTTYSFLGASNDGGAATPEEAVTTFVSAAEHEDLLGMIDVTVPEEVAVLRNAVTAAAGDAARTGVLGDTFDAGSVKGVDVSVDDLTLQTDFLEGGLAAVTATGGTFNAAFDPQSFPFGSKLRAILGTDMQTSSKSVALAGRSTPVLLMTVQRGGRWYVSVEYTIAEYVRRAANWESPAPLTRSPVGFGTAEDAANAFYDRLAALDLQGAIDTFAPGEDAMAWLAQSWLPQATAAIERGRANGWTLAVSGVTYESIGTDSPRTLRPVTFKVQGTVPAGLGQTSDGTYSDPSKETLVWAFDGSGYAIVPPGQVPATGFDLSFTPGVPDLGPEYNVTTMNPDGAIAPLVFAPDPTGGPQPFSVERADGCTTYTGTALQSMLGVGSTPAYEKVDGGYRTCGDGLGLGASVLLLAGGLTELPPVTVVQSGGKWYVSPLGTALASVSSSLHDLDAGASLFDSPLAPILYSGTTRAWLESALDGRASDSVAPACLPALTVDSGTITGIVADPDPAAIGACTADAFSSMSSSSTGANEPIVTMEPPTAVSASAPTTLAPATTSPTVTVAP